MAALRQYANRLWRVERALGAALGADPATASKEVRVLVKSLLMILAVVIKVTVDKGLVTDAEWENAFSFAEGDPDNTDEPIEPPS